MQKPDNRGVDSTVLYSEWDIPWLIYLGGKLGGCVA